MFPSILGVMQCQRWVCTNPLLLPMDNIGNSTLDKRYPDADARCEGAFSQWMCTKKLCSACRGSVQCSLYKNTFYPPVSVSIPRAVRARRSTGAHLRILDNRLHPVCRRRPLHVRLQGSVTAHHSLSPAWISCQCQKFLSHIIVR